MVDAARHAEGLVVDNVYLEATDTCIGACVRDGRLEMFLQLQRSRCLPRRGVAADEDELCASVASEAGRSTVPGRTGIFVARFSTTPGSYYLEPPLKLQYCA